MMAILSETPKIYPNKRCFFFAIKNSGNVKDDNMKNCLSEGFKPASFRLLNRSHAALPNFLRCEGV